jgi:acetyl-CoA C-acetyltransferase
VIRGYALTGCAPEIMGIGPVAATRKAVEKAGWTVEQLDLVKPTKPLPPSVGCCP